MNRVAIGVGGKLFLAVLLLARHPARGSEHSPFATDSGMTNQSLIDLPTALRLAGAQNLDIQIARERLNEARANHDSALEQFFPWISPGITYHRRDGLAQAVPAGTVSRADFDSYAPGGTIGAQMEIGDAIYKSLASKRVSQAFDNALEAQRQDSTLSAAQRFFELAKAKALVNVNKQAMETSQEYQNELHEAVGAGIAFKGDELRVQTETDGY
ncbi:MAG TPA: TolC family protein, partial [Verrucomicrobiae bacterium]|nr:TolC family protein [Verrucomicrobiae bacterium]